MAESCDNNIGGLAGSSDDSSSSCSDPLTTPPHRHKKPSTSTRAHTLEVRKSGRKKGRKPETSRASSEPSTDSDSPDSDRVVSKKHKIKKQHRKQSTGSHVHTDIFQKHYSDLVSLVQHCTVSIANRAYSKYMISRDVLCKVTNSQDSQASVLMFAIGDLLKVSPHKINKLVRCLEEEPSLHSVTKKMRNVIKMAAQAIPQEDTPQGDTPQSSTNELVAYRKYLQSYYQKTLTMRDDKLAIAPCSEFINLALVNKDSSTTALEIDEIVTPDSRFILVEGPPGMGKSTLCRELCRQWDTLKSLQDCKIVLQLKLRERRVQNAKLLDDIFYHRDKELSQSVVKEVYRCEGKGVLLVLDGFDEMSSSVVQDKGGLIMELIRGTCLPNAARLVTSRPSVLHRKGECFPEIHRHIEIVGFTDESKVKYAELAFKSEPDVFASFKTFIFSNPVINSLMHIPINCAIIAIIAQVYKDITSVKPIPKTMTQLYSTLIPVLIKRHMIERREWDSEDGLPNDLKDLPEKFVPALKRVSELAYKGLSKEQLVFSESDVGEGFQHLGLLSEAKEMYVCEGAVSSYSFLHLSIQEFLAAWHVKCHPDLLNDAVSIMPGVYSEYEYEYSFQPRLVDTFGYFIAGMIGCDHLKLPGCPLRLLIKCMYEAQDCSKLAMSARDIASSHLKPPWTCMLLGML